MVFQNDSDNKLVNHLVGRHPEDQDIRLEGTLNDIIEGPFCFFSVTLFVAGCSFILSAERTYLRDDNASHYLGSRKIRFQDTREV